MSNLEMRDYQIDAINRMKNGCILCGGVGSGKSITAIGYYYNRVNGGSIEPFRKLYRKPKKLIIITTAHKRDTFEWDGDLGYFLLTRDPEKTQFNIPVDIDSWNNIEKYSNVTDAFFIFDEQRVCGSGAWVKSFLKITKSNQWILLSATPGDCWTDYIPVFVANGFYRNRTDFINQHCVYSRYVKWKIDRYVNVGRLIRLRDNILIDMDYEKPSISHDIYIDVDYDAGLYRTIMMTRDNPFTNEPIKTASELCYALRRAINIHEDRQVKLLEIVEAKKKVIIFYNFDYELDILKELPYMVDGAPAEIAQWNGHAHQEIPTSDAWVYLVQYNAGCEGWNCIKTDTIVFYSLNYSYKVMSQAAGRIDRLNTPFKDLYYYKFKSHAAIDSAIDRALKNKKKFNETKFTGLMASQKKQTP